MNCNKSKLYSAQLKGAGTLWARVARKNIHINMCQETFNLWAIADFPAWENFYRCFVQRSSERLFVQARQVSAETASSVFTTSTSGQRKIHSRRQQVFIIICGQGLLVIMCVGHIGLQATTAGISSWLFPQSYWKLSHWQSEHECGTRMKVLRHILALLCEMFSVTPIMTDV
jgi:hypothetical protein